MTETMNKEKIKKDSQLINSLREGVGLIQMVLFKEVRTGLMQKKPNMEKSYLAMLAGAITNEVFGTQNPEEKFVTFRKQNWGEIEQELISLKEEFAELLPFLSDALRIQTLCDSQEGGDSTATLLRAKEFDYLLEERDIPLPSSFMTAVREVGKLHNLLIPPVEISPEQDESIVH